MYKGVLGILVKMSLNLIHFLPFELSKIGNSLFISYIKTLKQRNRKNI